VMGMEAPDAEMNENGAQTDFEKTMADPTSQTLDLLVNDVDMEWPAAEVNEKGAQTPEEAVPKYERLWNACCEAGRDPLEQGEHLGDALALLPSWAKRRWIQKRSLICDCSTFSSR